MSRILILGLGALYEDTVLNVPTLREDTKTRATNKEVRIGGNIINTFGVLSEAPPLSRLPLCLVFSGAVGTRESCRHVYTDLTSRRIIPYLLHRDFHGTASATIICAQDTGSRTIISHCNEIQDASAKELTRELSNLPSRWPDWIHVEGRNCIAVLEYLRGILASAFDGKISVDCELLRPGSCELVGVADVLFISNTFSEALVGQRGEVHGMEYVNEVLERLKCNIKPGATGHIMLGDLGSFCFQRHDSGKVHLNEGATVGATDFDVTDCRKEALLDTEVRETAGAGDTFVAGVIWASLKGLPPLEANRVGTALARKKCTQRGFKGLWPVLASDGPNSDLIS